MKRFALLIWIVCLSAAFQASGQDKITKAKSLFQQEKIREIISMLQNVSPTDVQYKEVLLLLGNAYLKEGKLDSAEIRGRQLLDINDKNVDAVLLVAQACAGQKKFADAYSVVRKGMKGNKNNPLLLVQLGKVHFAADSIEQAIVTFSLVKEVDPKNVDAFVGLGDAYQKQKADAVAILQYEEAVQIDSSRIDLMYTLAKLYQKERRYNEAAKTFIRVIQHSQDKVRPSLDLGKLYYAAKQFGNAAKVLANYVKVHPEDQEIWKMFTESLDNSKTYDVGLAIADSILKKEPNNPKALKLAGKCSTLVGKNNNSRDAREKQEKAIEHFKKLKNIQELNAEDIKYLGKAHFELKNDTLAIFNFEKSLSMDSTQSDIFMDLGFSYMRKKKWAKAASMFEKKFVVDSSYVSAYVNYALCQEQLQNWQASRKALITALKLAPTYIPGHFHLAYTYRQMGADSLPVAQKEYETMIALIDTNKTKYKNELGESYKQIAFINLVNKNWPAAQAAISNSLVFRPKDIELVLWNAQTLHAMGRKEEARKEYERVIRINPKSREAKDAQKGLDRLDLGF
jgi:tetratricopeptide (TPR) repeat protein